MRRKFTILAMAIALLLINVASVYAAEEVISPVSDVKYYKSLVSDREVVTVLINEASNKEKITKAELMAFDKRITDVKDLYRDDKKETALIKTGDYVYIGKDEYKVILYGDVNRDGTICDIQDMMYILDMLDGTKEKDEMRSIAGNIDNSNNTADVQDVLRMANIFLGIFNQRMITNVPEGYMTFEEKEGSENAESAGVLGDENFVIETIERLDV